MDAKTVAFLVEHHLLMIQTATRRDINDEETALSMARIVKKVELLKMLYLLSVADSMATGPKAWNEWTSSLLKNLFFKVLNVLQQGELTSGRAVKTVEKKRQALMDTMTDTLPADRLREPAQLHVAPIHALRADQRDPDPHRPLFGAG